MNDLEMEPDEAAPLIATKPRRTSRRVAGALGCFLGACALGLLARSEAPPQLRTDEWGALRGALGPDAELTLATDAAFLRSSVARNALKQASPAVIVRPFDEADVIAAVRYANSHKLPLTVFSTGHDYQGRSNGDRTLNLNMEKMRWARVVEDGGRKLLSLGPATPMEDAYAAGAPHDLVPVKSVGVGGFTLGGGHGPLSRRFGLGADQLVRARVVLGDGSVAVASERGTPFERDLLYALRGGGAAYGVVTEFVVAAHAAPPRVERVVFSAPMVSAAGIESGRAALKRFFHNATWWASLDPGWAGWSSASCRLVADFRTSERKERGSVDWARATDWAAQPEGWGTLEARLVYTGATPEGADSLRELFDYRLEGGDVLVERHVVEGGMPELMATEGGQREGQYLRQLIGNVFIAPEDLEDDRLTDLVVDTVTDRCDGGRSWGPIFFYNHVLGRAVSDPARAATSSVSAGFRKAVFEVGVNDAWADAADDPLRAGPAAAVAEQLYAFAASSYGNEVTRTDEYSSAIVNRDWQQRFYGAHYPRLLAVKRQADPCGLLWARYGVGSDLARFRCGAPNRPVLPTYTKDSACARLTTVDTLDAQALAGTWYKHFESWSLTHRWETGKSCIQVHMDSVDGGLSTVVKWAEGGSRKACDAAVALPDGPRGNFSENGKTVPYDVVHFEDSLAVVASCVPTWSGPKPAAWVMTRDPLDVPDRQSVEAALRAAGSDVRLEAIPQTCAWPDQKEVVYRNVDMPQFRCGADQALVAFPRDVEEGHSYPLVALAHGVLYDQETAGAAHCAGGVEACYGSLLGDIARAGFIVVAPKTDAPGWCEHAAEDQAAVIRHVYGHPSDLWKAVDWSQGAGLLGHSMGGLATVVNADLPRVGAAVAVAPYTADAAVAPFAAAAFPDARWDALLGADGEAPGSATRAPLAVFGSTADELVPAATLEALYGRVPATTPGLLALVPGRSHRALKEDHLLSDFYAGFLNCRLKDDAAACDAVSSFCAGADVCESRDV